MNLKLTPKDLLLGATSISTLGSSSGACALASKTVAVGNTLKSNDNKEKLRKYATWLIFKCIDAASPHPQCNQTDINKIKQHLRDAKSAMVTFAKTNNIENDFVEKLQ